MAEIIPEDLDAHESLKPGEKHFTLQAGDPLAPGLMRLWAKLARYMAGVGKLTMDEAALIVVQSDRVNTNELLLRASSAEMLAEDFIAYQKGHDSSSRQTLTDAEMASGTNMIGAGGEEARASFQRHLERNRLSRKLSNIDAEIWEVIEAVAKLELSGAEEPMRWLANVSSSIKGIEQNIVRVQPGQPI